MDVVYRLTVSGSPLTILILSDEGSLPRALFPFRVTTVGLQWEMIKGVPCGHCDSRDVKCGHAMLMHRTHIYNELDFLSWIPKYSK